MLTIFTNLERLSDPDLVAEVKRLAAREAVATAHLVASLAELEVRRLHLAEGCTSLFAYCTEVLGLSEGAAYRRIEAARLARRFPLVLERLAIGAIHLGSLHLLAPHLTPENQTALLDAARGRTRRDVEELVARIDPQPDAPSLVRKLPEPKRVSAPSDLGGESAVPALADDLAQPRADLLGTASTPGTPRATAASPGRTPQPEDAPLAALHPPAHRAGLVVLAPERYKVQMTVGPETQAKLRRVQDLLRHTVPNGDVAVIFDRALTLLLSDLERKKLAATKRADGADPAKRMGAQRVLGGGCDARRAIDGTPPPNVARASRTATATTIPRVFAASALPDGRTGAPGSLGVATPSAMGFVGTPTQRPAGGRPEGGTSLPGRRRTEPAARGRKGRSGRSRYIPAGVRRAVWRRDQGRCTYVGPTGRCRQTGGLEFHHLVPFAVGGASTVEGLCLRCRPHNLYEAEEYFGRHDARPGSRDDLNWSRDQLKTEPP